MHHNGKNPYRVVIRYDSTGELAQKYTSPVSQGLEYLKLDIPKHEIISAEEYLIKSGYLDGTIQQNGMASVFDIRGITNSGIDLVENAVQKLDNNDLRKAILGNDPVKIGDHINRIFRYPVLQEFQKLVDIVIPMLQGAS